MKKVLTVLLAALAVASLLVSCGEDPFFHAVSIKYEDKVVKTVVVRDGDEYTLPGEVDGIPGISGWTIDGKEYAVGDKITVSCDITITALTGPADVTVTFKYGDKEYTVKMKPSEVASWDGTLEDGTKWTKDGFVIGSWYSDDDGTFTYYSSSSTIPDGVTLYPDWVDENLSFELIEGKTTYRAGVSSEKQNSVTDVKIPALYRGDKVTEIGDFSECEELKTVTLDKPENIDSISKSAFDCCEKLESIDLSGTKITEIKDSTFTRCLVLPTVKLPSTLTTIGPYAFYQCKKLTAIDLPESLTSIGYEAFAQSGLVSIKIPKNVRTLGPSDDASVFYNCTALKTVVIEEGLTALTRATFSGCTSLESVTLPDSLTSIDRSFYGCTSLTFINIPQSVTQIDTYAFDGCTNLKNINMEIAEADAPADLKSGAALKWKAANATVNWGQKFYRLGETGPAGGIVFYDAGSTQTGKYIDSTGAEKTYTWRYLEARATDYVYLEYSSGNNLLYNDYAFEFGTTTSSSMVVTDTTENVKIGAGRYNTTALVKAMGTTVRYAAMVCDTLSDEYDGKTYDDWFLPSAKELEAMYEISNIRSTMADDGYWSSSEDGIGTAWDCDGGRLENNNNKTNACRVRPVRAFL